YSGGQCSHRVFAAGELRCSPPHCRLTSSKLGVISRASANPTEEPDMTHFLRIPPFAAGRAGFSTADATIRLVKGLIVPAIVFATLGGLDASAAPILDSATRTTAF